MLLIIGESQPMLYVSRASPRDPVAETPWPAPLLQGTHAKCTEPRNSLAGRRNQIL
jgi:hypothetical protein